MTKQHIAIIIPGLGDDSASSIKRIEMLTSHWINHGITPLIHAARWRDGEPFEPKLLRLLALIDSLSTENKVSLVGTSAGASMALNAFLERKETVHKVVNVCGRLRAGDHKIRSLTNMAKTSIAFKESVERFEQNEPKLTMQDKKRVLTLRPFFGDELVPADTVIIEGATNKVVYIPTHMLGIGFSLKFSKQLLGFLKN